ncbi:MAG: hypothetical protein VX346_01910 [Planctomycetota bacterium]|nr:hypothetical protein [Planctomycetota bacterium]
MPRQNHFRHQQYSPPDPTQHELVAPTGIPWEQQQLVTNTANAARQIRRANVSGILLIHGTFVGTDALGLFRKIAHIWKPGGKWLQQVSKQLLNAIAQDAGNYTPRYAELLETAVNQDGGPHIPVQLFAWSGENHHLGRADGAIKLLDQLTQWQQLRPGRILCWGHSHGGNLLAILTNLLGGSHRVRRRFIKIINRFYRWSGDHAVAQDTWRTMQRFLEKDGPLFPDHNLDMVTFGTPIRYGWDTGIATRLLHFVHHRCCADRRPDQAPYPPSAGEFLQATHGDCVQQIGIAGTNWSPTIFSWRARRADRRLHRILQKGVRSRDLLTHLEQGGRVAEDGHTLLVNYGDPANLQVQHLGGHSIYTRLEWLAFHLNEVTSRFYSSTETLRTVSAAHQVDGNRISRE